MHGCRCVWPPDEERTRSGVSPLVSQHVPVVPSHSPLAIADFARFHDRTPTTAAAWPATLVSRPYRCLLWHRRSFLWRLELRCVSVEMATRKAASELVFSALVSTGGHGMLSSFFLAVICNRDAWISGRFVLYNAVCVVGCSFCAVV
jgi:hypothetical protein